MQYVSVRSVASRLKDQFGVDMDIYNCVSACRDALKKMGMLALSRFIFLGKVDNFKVLLPNTVWKVRGTTRLTNYPQVYSGSIIISDQIDQPPQIVFTESEHTLDMTNVPELLKSNYVPQLTGPYVDYVWKRPHLNFNETNFVVAIECTGLTLDDEGLPMLPEEAFFGCLYYALFVHYQPLLLRKQVDPGVWQQIVEWKDSNIAQSNADMMMQALSSNAKDDLFNVMSSFDRKQYGKPI